MASYQSTHSQLLIYQSSFFEFECEFSETYRKRTFVHIYAYSLVYVCFFVHLFFCVCVVFPSWQVYINIRKRYFLHLTNYIALFLYEH